MATIKDVAREARVSVASVSRALNGQAGVTEQTQQRIREVAARLRYIPHGAARSLITRRSHTIGALLPDLHGEFFSELIRGIDLAARSRGLHLLVSSSHDDALEAAAAMRAMQGRVDGLLVMSPHANLDFLRDNLPANLPTVLMNTALEACADYAALSIDNRGGTRLVMEHLLASGRRRIAFIRGPETNHDVAEREQAYRDALAASLPDAAVQVCPGDFSEQSGYAAGRQLAAQTPRPDAVVAANDMMAIGCMSALREAGLRIPEDVAVAGFDDVPMARYITPALTTVRVRIAELGEQAMSMLNEQLESTGPVALAQHRVPVELMVRESTVQPGQAPHGKPQR